MENSIFDIIVLFISCNVPRARYFTSFYLEANDLSNQHMCGFLNKNLILPCFVYVVLSHKCWI
jgi:hypothetical protein